MSIWFILLIIAAVMIIALFITANIFFDKTISADINQVTLSDTESDKSNPFNAKGTIFDKEAETAWVDAHAHTQEGITSFDGLKLKAMLFMVPQPTHRYAIMVHGYTSRGKWLVGFGQHYYDKGWNVLLPDLRGAGDSEGKSIGMGWFDRLDVIGWINFLLKKDPEAEIVLHGLSMGSATVLMVSGEKLPANVKCIISDCGYDNVRNCVMPELKRRLKIPTPILYPFCTLVTRLRAGWWLGDADTVRQVKKSVTPTLFIHGGNDIYVPTEMVYKLYEACSAPKNLLVVKDASHAQSAVADPELYWKTVWDFIEKGSNESDKK